MTDTIDGTRWPGRALALATLLLAVAALTGCSAGAKSVDDDGGSGDKKFGDMCLRSGDCLSGLECVATDPLTGSICTNVCDGPSECPSGSTCVITDSGDYCAPGGTDTPGDVGSPCDNNKDCARNLQCFQAAPDADPLCVQTCDPTSSDCPAGQPCVPVSEIGYCDFNATNNPQGCDPACGEDQQCVDGECVTPGPCDPACDDDQQCIDGECVDVNVCDPVCGEDQQCVEGQCVTTNPCDPACADDQECIDGTCHDLTEPCNPACEPSERCEDGTCVAAGLCDPPCSDTETCVDGACVQTEMCETSGQSCTATTEDGANLVCISADNTSSQRTCRTTCSSDGQCEATEFCGAVDGRSACLPGNCDGVLSSASECGGVGGNGGTCLVVRDGVFYCEPAGTGVKDSDCVSHSDCAAALLCVDGTCAEPCDLDAPQCAAGTCTSSSDVREEGLGACIQAQACGSSGDACDSSAEDTGTLACVEADPMASGDLSCLPICDLVAPACPSASVCQVVDRGGDPVAVCLPGNCLSPLNEAECAGMGADGGNCLPAGNDTFRCVAAGAGTDGSACTSSRECGAGLACNGAFCRPLCDLASGIGCAVGDICEPTLGDTVAGTCAPQTCDSCGLAEICFRGECVNQSQCEVVGQPCEDFTTANGALLCVGGANSLDPTEVTCHRGCDSSFDDCPTGSFCVPFDSAASTEGACLRSNCTSPLESATECAPIGGTCGIFVNDTYLCMDAGAGITGSSCESSSDCAVGLDCLAGQCTALCDRSSPACPAAEACVPVYGTDTPFGDCWAGCPGFEETDFCGAGSGCVPITATEGLCLDVGPRLEGQSCDPTVASEACGEWLSCIDMSGSGGICEPWCNLTAPDPGAACAPGDTCGDVFGDDTVGLCLESCTPFVEEVANGCGTNGFKACVPQGDGSEGHCLFSGPAGEGQSCDSASLFGGCRGGLACGVDGSCAQMCQTFSGATECAASEICDPYGSTWGLCSSSVLPGGLAPFDPCSTPGMWCADTVLCLALDATTNACLELCRMSEGNGDCDGADVCTAGVLVSDALGVCLPPN